MKYMSSQNAKIEIRNNNALQKKRERKKAPKESNSSDVELGISSPRLDFQSSAQLLWSSAN